MITVIHSIFNWFTAARPQLTTKQFHTQLGVHFEEVSEMLAEMTGMNGETRTLIEKAKQATHELGEHLKKSDLVVMVEHDNRIGFLDALCDQIVTAIGCAQASEMNIAEGLDEVDRSNWSKFDAFGDPIFDPNGKIMKGPDYFKADLAPFV